MRGVLRKTCDVSAEVTLVAQSHHRFTRPCRLREAQGEMGKRKAVAMPSDEDPEHLAAIVEAFVAADAEDDLL